MKCGGGIGEGGSNVKWMRERDQTKKQKGSKAGRKRKIAAGQEGEGRRKEKSLAVPSEHFSAGAR